MDPALIQELAAPAIAIAVPLIVAAVKWGGGRLPKWSLPLLAGALGPALDQLIAAIAASEAHGVMAVIYGLAGVGIREVRDQVGRHFQGPMQWPPAGSAGGTAGGPVRGI